MKRWWLVPVLASGCASDHELGESAAAFGSTRWAIAVGGANDDGGTVVAIDCVGDVIAGGIMDKDTSAHTYITKRAGATGAEMWTHSLGPTTTLHALAGLPSDGVVAAGLLTGDFDFGGASLANRGSDSFVVEYDAKGRALWASGLAVNSQATIESIAIGDEGRIYASGTCMPMPLTGTLGAVTSPDTGVTITCDGAFIAAFSSDGVLLWFRAYQAVGSMYAVSRFPLLGMPDGRVLAVSSIDAAPVTLDSITVTPTASSSILLAQVAPSGGVSSASVIGDRTLAQDAQQVAATTSGFITIGQNGPVDSLKIAEWDSSGNAIWSTAPIQPLEFLALTVTDVGAVVSAGAELSGNQAGPMFLMAHSAKGQYLGSRSYGGARPSAVATGSSGQIAFVGKAWGQADVGTGPLANAGSNDMLIGVIDPPPKP